MPPTTSEASLKLHEIPVVARSERQRHALTRALEAFFVRHRDRLAWLHLGMFVLFLALLFGPLFLPSPAENAGPLDHPTTFANYLLWGLWFPLVFLSVIFTGRSWCGLLCPMGAASEWANRRGLQRPIPAWVRWEGTPILSFLLITILGQTLGVRDHPEAVAEVFGGTLLAAIVLGFLYGRNKRAWCRHMCPIGLLLGVFSRLGAVQFWPKRKRPGGDAYTERGLCPTLIDINRKEESRHCIECFRCVHPQSKGGLMLRLRRPGREVEAIRDHNPNAAEVWFLFLGTGAALGGFLWLVLPAYNRLRQAVGEWFIEHGHYWIGEAGPAWLMSVHPDRREVFNWLDFMMIVGFMLACTLLLTLLLSLTTGLSAWLAGRSGADLDLRRRFIELGYAYAPVAMVSLVIGLGGELFEALRLVDPGGLSIGYAKGVLFVLSLLWSIQLGNRILQRQGVAGPRRWLPLLPSTAGSLAVGLAWWPAIFGL
ncbi:4Fe-4S binding protein [Thiohalobacter sp. IOR34]|uniref:4Fe-4S binding protein n=1 Tax=Thiohalobacter sp. IOR34 TaxID=3057176 RepID=UPI0025B0ACAC|nr:4Fe-4S binding protein [Thiohalobacter sp. IOR34]WJW75810.1 4Fe-4S binding protein [Thiohalobacter sp. IOR34]